MVSTVSGVASGVDFFFSPGCESGGITRRGVEGRFGERQTIRRETTGGQRATDYAIDHDFMRPKAKAVILDYTELPSHWYF